MLYWHGWDPASTKADRVVLTGGMADRRLDPPEAALALHPLGPGATGGIDMLVRRSAFDGVGGFEARFRGRYEDEAFLMKIFLRYPIYISSRSWYYYRQHPDSCCGQTTPADWSKVRGAFLDYLQELEDDGRLADPRVRAAFRRARHAFPYQKLAYQLYGRLPLRLKWYMLEHRWQGRAATAHNAG